MKLIAVLFLSLTISGCATISPTCDVPRASGDEAASIVVYRPSGLVGALYSTPMSINNCRVKSVANNSFVVYQLPSGVHRIAVEKRTMELGFGAHVEQEFEGGQEYYLRQNVNIVAGLSVVSKEKALSDMPKLQSVSQ